MAHHYEHHGSPRQIILTRIEDPMIARPSLSLLEGGGRNKIRPFRQARTRNSSHSSEPHGRVGCSEGEAHGPLVVAPLQVVQAYDHTPRVGATWGISQNGVAQPFPPRGRLIQSVDETHQETDTFQMHLYQARTTPWNPIACDKQEKQGSN